MHHGTCATYMPWCMSGSVTRGKKRSPPYSPQYYVSGKRAINHIKPMIIFIKLDIICGCVYIHNSSFLTEYCMLSFNISQFNQYDIILPSNSWRPTEHHRNAFDIFFRTEAFIPVMNNVNMYCPDQDLLVHAWHTLLTFYQPKSELNCIDVISPISWNM